MRFVYLAIGLVCTGLGVVGSFVPLLPGVPFLIIALWAFTKSSPRFEHWLLTHERYGPPLVAWRANRVIPMKVKLVAWASMIGSLAILVLTTSWLVVGIAASAMAIGAVYIGSKPSRPPSAE